MFSHELNSFRNLDGKDAHNYYPSHFVWLLTYGNSGKDQFVQYVGVPSAATYGGQTTSKLFGYQEASQNDFGWMTGYDKWYEAMFNRTVLTVVVPGRGYRAPLNVAVNGNTLTWSKPAASKNVLIGFRVYKGTDELLATLDAGTTHYALPEDAAGSYAVQAVYGSKQSVSVSATVPAKSTSNKCLKADHTGFTIPGVFGSKYDKATIEYWIRPMSLSNWNQSAGPGWG